MSPPNKGIALNRSMNYTLYGMAQRGTNPDLSSGWTTYEIYERNAEGEYEKTPFSAALAGSGVLAKPAVTKMRMVQALGWPEAKRVLKDDQGRPLVVKKDDVIWLLKCKPSCWRLYFYVNTQRIVYLLAVCKKNDKEDPKNAVEARRIYEGRSGITAFEFPAS